MRDQDSVAVLREMIEARAKSNATSTHMKLDGWIERLQSQQDGAQGGEADPMCVAGKAACDYPKCGCTDAIAPQDCGEAGHDDGRCGNAGCAPQATPAAVDDAMVERALGALGCRIIDGRQYWSEDERRAMHDALTAALAAPPAEVKP